MTLRGCRRTDRRPRCANAQDSSIVSLLKRCNIRSSKDSQKIHSILHLSYERLNSEGRYDDETFRCGNRGWRHCRFGSCNELAQAAKSVVLFERSNQLGGRAISVKKNGAIFDLGAHGIIKGGAMDEIFQDLGIRIEGGYSSTNVSFLWNNKVTNIFKFIFSHNLSWSGKMEFLKFCKTMTTIDTDSVPAISLRSWIEQELRDPMARHIVYTMFRINSYCKPRIPIGRPRHTFCSTHDEKEQHYICAGRLANLSRSALRKGSSVRGLHDDR
ncbi:hypothetical protein CBW46_020635 [Paenibacillus xerothermodurans]|uniref:Amine oxidase domain-containing protein n=1 Tax=Paenibacillus xerothermodurans TaxID=1977292 RepID=A0A2W1N7B7_PAEXE|nr:hypothetical protein CBW46_020635 [Paenibacillus xerothermodurans]